MRWRMKKKKKKKKKKSVKTSGMSHGPPSLAAIRSPDSRLSAHLSQMPTIMRDATGRGRFLHC